MKFFLLIILYFLSSNILLFAQSRADIDILETHYESFEYSYVISKADDLLLHKNLFSDQSLIKIFTLKAASHFAVGEQLNSRKSFIEILKVDSNYKLNDVLYSPKLLNLFNSVKQEFYDIIQTNNNVQQFKNEPEINKQLTQSTSTHHENTAVAKSLILPGWGHLHNNENTKGWILTSVGTAALGSMIYYTFESNSRERDYLSERNSELIQSKYNEYNNSYKIRNLLIASYAAIWLYTQIDLLFFSNNLGSQNLSIHNFDYGNTFNQQKMLFSLKFPF